MPRGSSTCLGSRCVQPDPRERLSFLLRHSSVPTQHAGHKGTTGCAVLGWMERNHPLSPDQVNVSSSMRAHRKCSACLHEWQAGVGHKAHDNTGCPKCAQANGGRKADGSRQKHPTFAEAKHTLLEQWDHNRNSENVYFPDNTTLGSTKRVWWCCRECPKGKVHSWQASPNNRIPKRARGCPCCVGHKLCECNSLETVSPDVAADFDTEKNGVLLKSQVQHQQGIAGCQMSLGLKSVLWIGAHATQNDLTQQVETPDLLVYNRWTCALRSTKPSVR